MSGITLEDRRTAQNRGLLFKLAIIPIGMFGFAYALVPLYDVFCDITGLNGKTGRIAAEDSISYAIDDTREVQVTFLASRMPGMSVSFAPKDPNIIVTPGKTQTIAYVAENRGDSIVWGQAVPSVAPGAAAQHFKKIECFCFTQQEFLPGQRIEMPVTFVVEPGLDESIRDVSLSYNLFKIEPPKG